MRGAEAALRQKEALRICARAWRRTDKGRAASKAREEKRRGTSDWSKRSRNRSSLTVLDEAARVGADFIMLQETRHWDACGWAVRFAELRGWRCSFSPPPPRARGQGGPRQAGTAVLWRTNVRSSHLARSRRLESSACGLFCWGFSFDATCELGEASWNSGSPNLQRSPKKGGGPKTNELLCTVEASSKAVC